MEPGARSPRGSPPGRLRQIKDFDPPRRAAGPPGSAFAVSRPPAGLRLRSPPRRPPRAGRHPPCASRRGSPAPPSDAPSVASGPRCDRNIPNTRKVIEATTNVAARITTAVSTIHLYPPRRAGSGGFRGSSIELDHAGEQEDEQGQDGGDEQRAQAAKLVRKRRTRRCATRAAAGKSEVPAPADRTSAPSRSYARCPRRSEHAAGVAAALVTLRLPSPEASPPASRRSADTR